MKNDYVPRPRYVQGGVGNIFVLELCPEGRRHGTVLMVPPFAEEMNRARRTMFLQATQLSSSGFRVLLPDLYGTGDSEGEFSDAAWDTWRNDIDNVIAAYVADDSEPLSFIAVRLGSLLLLDLLNTSRVRAEHVVLWQPVTTGRNYLTQFLRLRTMSGMLSQAKEREDVKALRSKLVAGHHLEVAGYDLSPDLARCIDELDIVDLVRGHLPATTWIDVVHADNRPPPIQSQKIILEMQNRGCSVTHMVSQGPQFWSTPEISIANKVVAATTAVLQGTLE